MKLVIKTYKYKIKPNSIQEEKLTSWIHTCRTVYNLALDARISAYTSRKVSLNKYDLIKQLPELREEFDWIKDVPSQTLQAVVERMDTAYKSFFRGGGFPKWANRFKYNSLLFKQGVKIVGNKILLPKLGKLNYFNSREIPQESKIKQATIIKEIDGFYICIVVEQFQTKQLYSPLIDRQEIGLDMGVSLFYALSNGKTKNNPKIVDKFSNNLRLEQRSLARKKKGSNNWIKQKKKVQKVNGKIKNVRSDFLHKCSTELVSYYDLIAIEDLKIKNMTKSSKGNSEEHGKMVKQKSGLNRVLLDVSIGSFFEKLDYKCNWYNTDLVRVDPKYTSQICSNCGSKSKGNRKTQSRFECKSCGYKENADVNAAKNILVRAEPMSVNVVH